MRIFSYAQLDGGPAEDIQKTFVQQKRRSDHSHDVARLRNILAESWMTGIGDEPVFWQRG
jgi:hypothetical protein